MHNVYRLYNYYAGELSSGRDSALATGKIRSSEWSVVFTDTTSRHSPILASDGLIRWTDKKLCTRFFWADLGGLLKKFPVVLPKLVSGLGSEFGLGFRSFGCGLRVLDLGFEV